MSDRKKIGITFAVFNNCDFTKKCLESIFSSKTDHDLYVVVVDNGSTDKSVEMINKNFSQVKIISNKKNMGCAIAWNQGLRDCVSEGCDYISLCQNDIIISTGTIDDSVGFLEENENFGIISPMFINVPWHSKINLTQKELDTVTDQCKEKFSGDMGTSFCFYFFMMRLDVFEKVQFDEKFVKVFYEDIDFYNSVYTNKIICSKAIDVGLGFHKFSATVAIAQKNLGLHENKKIFESKWKDKKDLVKDGQSFVNGCFKVRMRFKQKNHGLDMEGEGLYPVEKKGGGKDG